MAQKDEEDTKRFCVSIPKSLDERLNKYIPWGQKEQVLRELLEMLASACEKSSSNIVIYSILDGKAKLDSNYPQM